MKQWTIWVALVGLMVGLTNPVAGAPGAPASQAQVNAGTAPYLWVTPLTLTNWFTYMLGLGNLGSGGTASAIKNNGGIGTNTTLVGTNTLISGQSSNCIPYMTGYTSPWGVASASSESGPYLAYLGFEGGGQNWQALAGGPSWLQYQMPTPVTVIGFTVQGMTDANSSMAFWSSMDGVNWVTNYSGVDAYKTNFNPVVGQYFRWFFTAGSVTVANAQLVAEAGAAGLNAPSGLAITATAGGVSINTNTSLGYALNVGGYINCAGISYNGQPTVTYSGLSIANGSGTNAGANGTYTPNGLGFFTNNASTWIIVPAGYSVNYSNTIYNTAINVILTNQFALTNVNVILFPYFYSPSFLGYYSPNLVGPTNQLLVQNVSAPATFVLGTPGNSTTPVYLAPSNGPVWVSAMSIFDDFVAGSSSEVYGSAIRQNGGTAVDAPLAGYNTGRNGFFRFLDGPSNSATYATISYCQADYTLWNNCYCSADVLFQTAITNLFVQIGIESQVYASGGVFGSNMTTGVAWELNASLSPNFIARCGGASTTTWTNATPVALNTWYRLSFWGNTNAMVFGINDVPVWTNNNSATLPGGVANENVQIITGTCMTNPITGGANNTMYLDKFSFLNYQ